MKVGDTGKNIFGKVWPAKANVVVNISMPWDEQIRLYRQHAVYPDYFHPNIRKYWGDLIKDFHKVIEFDGLWMSGQKKHRKTQYCDYKINLP